MRGRLPATATPTDPPHHDINPVLMPAGSHPWRPHSDEELDFDSLAIKHQRTIQRVLSGSTFSIAPYRLSACELSVLTDIVSIVQKDVQLLQHELVRAGRPPDERDQDWDPPPDWDNDFIHELVNSWGEPVSLEADFFLLRSMSLFQLATSQAVAVLGLARVRDYLEMSLTLAQKGHDTLQSAFGPDKINAINTCWRFPTLISRIYQQLAIWSMNRIKAQEDRAGYVSDKIEYKTAREMTCRALRAFEQGIAHYPNLDCQGVHSTAKAEEYSLMANVAEMLAGLLDGPSAKLTWTQHAEWLLLGALGETRPEDSEKTNDLLRRVSNLHLQFAVWMFKQPHEPLEPYPNANVWFKEIKSSAVAEYAKQVFKRTDEKELVPRSFTLVIDCLYMLSLICVSTHLIHGFSREAAQWVRSLQKSLPLHKVEYGYLVAAQIMENKDKAMQALAAHRRNALDSDDQ
ncbi:hypothetical protein BGW38_009763 [Lunasporangiospora selenospora]|uniref:Uncharacterized protein n=1 Tax=Lunasporangiospora selenospora TaxID=979761 RepID=A0A9P6KF65_9FUNG|nr:hypothetical protein BGW38_009763 [Lunasporangiospora selenospora]